MRLRNLSFILLTLVALLPCLILSVVIYQKVYRLTERTVEQKLERVAKQINADVVHEVAILSNGLTLLSEQNLMRLGMDNLFYAKQVYVALNNFGNNNDLIESLYLVSEDGYVVESYAGDILAFEDSNIIKLEKYKQSMMYSDKITAAKYQASPWVEYFDNAALLEQDNHSGGIAFIIPISSSVKLNSIDIHGHLIAIVPVYKIAELASSVKNHDELINISVEGKLIAGNSLEQGADDVIKTNRIAITSGNFKNTLWLDLNIAQSSEEIIKDIRTELTPVLTTGAVMLVILLLIAITTAHFISRGFNQLNHLIEGFQLGGKINTQSFFITEFKDLNHLLLVLQSTINVQVQNLNDKNSELARVDKLRDKYLQEVKLLNSGLELQVASRTEELALTLGKVEHGHFVFQQLIKYRRSLENCNTNRSVVDITLNSIQTCLPDISVALYLPQQIKHRAVFQNINIERLDPYLINQQYLTTTQKEMTDRLITINDETFVITSFKVSNNKVGWILIKEKTETPEQKNWLTLFIAEISSYLMMRSLNEHLDRVASTDSLTGLQNRKSFDYQLGKLQANSISKVGLYVIDVNGLKTVNDNQGHEKGDALIKSAAMTLKACCEHVTSNVYRIGGDEFAIILKQNELLKADILNDKLIKRQRRALDDDRAVSFSFGYDCTDNCAFEMLYKSADHNMYKDKNRFYAHRSRD